MSLLVLCGKTCSGKTTLQYHIDKFGINKIVTYTTRPMRKGEIDKVTYNFIDKDKFLELEKNGFFAETTSYTVASGDTWYYGTAKEDIEKGGCIILNPNGLKKFRDMGLDMIAFYIDVPDFELKKRLELRGDNKKEAERRLRKDEIDFEDDVINELVDWYVADWWSSPYDMADKIQRVYRNMMNRRKEGDKYGK